MQDSVTSSLALARAEDAGWTQVEVGRGGASDGQPSETATCTIEKQVASGTPASSVNLPQVRDQVRSNGKTDQPRGPASTEEEKKGAQADEGNATNRVLEGLDKIEGNPICPSAVHDSMIKGKEKM
jgi:hypothetical protein